MISLPPAMLVHFPFLKNEISWLFIHLEHMDTQWDSITMPNFVPLKYSFNKQEYRKSYAEQKPKRTSIAQLYHFKLLRVIKLALPFPSLFVYWEGNFIIYFMSTPDYSTETLDRIKKLERMRSLGVNPFATRYSSTHTI